MQLFYYNTYKTTYILTYTYSYLLTITYSFKGFFFPLKTKKKTIAQLLFFLLVIYISIVKLIFAIHFYSAVAYLM